MGAISTLCFTSRAIRHVMAALRQGGARAGAPCTLVPAKAIAGCFCRSYRDAPQLDVD